jgi:hypothetical protein
MLWICDASLTSTAGGFSPKVTLNLAKDSQAEVHGVTSGDCSFIGVGKLRGSVDGG